ncbi:MAG: hypothetical protein AB1746_14985 [Candidatus Zixiibacteriota bacterium]
MRNRLLLLFISLGMSLFLGFMSCCDDCPTCPKEEEPPPLGKFRLYSICFWDGMLISYDIPADTIVDSVTLPYQSYGVFVTPDGERLLVMRAQENNFGMDIFSARDLSLLGSTNQYGDYYFDGTDGYGIMLSFTDESIYFVDPVNLYPTDTIVRFGNHGYLDTVGNNFFGVKYPGINIVYRIDCNIRQLIDSIVLPGTEISEICYNHYSNELYYSCYNPYPYAYFIQYDLNNKTILNETMMTGGSWGAAITIEGDRIFANDSGSRDWLPPGYIWVFDALTNEVCHLIEPFDYATGTILHPSFGQILMTPDGRRAYIASSYSMIAETPIAVVDLQTEKIIKVLPSAYGFGGTSIALGPVPE